MKTRSGAKKAGCSALKALSAKSRAPARRPVKGQVIARLRKQAQLQAAQADGLPGEKLVFNPNQELRGFERSCDANRAKMSNNNEWDTGLVLYLDDGVSYAVDIVPPKVAETVTRMADAYQATRTFLVDTGTIKLNPAGTKSTPVDLVILDLPQRNIPAKGQGFNSANESWPAGMVVIGVARTLPELVHTCKDLLASNSHVQLVVGIKQYEMKTEKLVALVFREGKGTKAVSFGTKALEATTLQLLNTYEAQVTGTGCTQAPACDKAGLDEYQVDVGFGQELLIDLYLIQRLLEGEDVKLPQHDLFEDEEAFAKMMEEAFAQAD